MDAQVVQIMCAKIFMTTPTILNRKWPFLDATVVARSKLLLLLGSNSYINSPVSLNNVTNHDIQSFA